MCVCVCVREENIQECARARGNKDRTNECLVHARARRRESRVLSSRRAKVLLRAERNTLQSSDSKIQTGGFEQVSKKGNDMKTRCMYSILRLKSVLSRMSEQYHLEGTPAAIQSKALNVQ